MDTITRLSIVPFLILCISVLGCAVFPGQQEEVTFPREQEQSSAKQEQSSAKIIMPKDDQRVEIQSGQSADEQKLSALFRGLPSLTNESFDSQFSTQQTPSLVPDGLLSNEAPYEPDRHEPMVQADRIEFAQDEVPFGNRIRTASHFAVEPKSMPTTAQDAEITLSITDTVNGKQIIWPVGDDNPTIRISGQEFAINATSSIGSAKMLIQANGELRDIDWNLVVPQVSTYKFSGSWATEQEIRATISGNTVTVRANSTKISDIVASVAAELNKSKVEGFRAITWRLEGTDTLMATADPGGIFTCAITPVTATTDPETKPVIGSAESVKVGVAIPSKLDGTTTGKNLPESKEIHIKVWIADKITKDTINSPKFRAFTVIPASNSDPYPPYNLKVANAKYVAANDFDPTVAETFFGTKPFIRLEGLNGTKGELDFILRAENGDPISGVEIANKKIESINDEKWSAEIILNNLLPGNDTQGRLFVLRKQADKKHRYATKSVLFKTPGWSDTPATLNLMQDGVENFTKNNKDVYQGNKSDTKLTVENTSNEITNDFVVVAKMDGGPVLGLLRGASGNLVIPVKGLKEGSQRIILELNQGGGPRGTPITIPVFVRTEGPKVISVEPSNFGTAPGVSSLTISFDRNNPIKAPWEAGAETATRTSAAKAVISIYGTNGTGVFTGDEEKIDHLTGAKFDKIRNAITITYDRTQLPADIYELRIDGSKIQDVYGNELIGDDGEKGTLYTKVLGGDILAAGGLAPKFKADDSPTINTGISGTTGEFVAFPEFVKRPVVESGFNPNDKVETRVVRLYYYRDAHRIAQIVNRKVQSYNRAAVKTNRQLADKSRNQANQLTVARQNAERNAIIMANKTRQQENEMQRAENSLNGSLQQLTNYRRDNPDANPNDDATIKQLESLVNSFSNQVNNLQADVQASRDQEVQANEQAQQAEAQEKMAREEQFRREVAAAHSDPDTYAPGKITSVDPVEQVSVSVVGEGLIQLRGPLKGINLIRTAIDQLDSPVGQVRISLHTIQINGEHADRMEVVAKKVQTYIDHARFLTMQSSEMLRKAVVQVASQKAEEASALFPGATQQDRDERYIMAFFGKDFIDELKAMDSEFLHTGNKLLSLHSMDTTSLASALNLMALAKNSTRQEIFAVFDGMCQTQLPQAEQNYFAAGWTCPKKKKKHLFHRCKDCEPEYCPMACNARFESLRGFFDMQISNDDTMTPLQREFIRLAQIFKSRLVTELEYKQRVMERAIIEERLGNRNKELEDAARKEKAANKELARMQDATIEGRVNMIKLIKEIDQGVQAAVEEVFSSAIPRSNFLSDIASFAKTAKDKTTGSTTLDGQTVEFEKIASYVKFDEEQFDVVKKALDELLTDMRYIHSTLKLLATIQKEAQFKTDLKDLEDFFKQIKKIKLGKGEPRVNGVLQDVPNTLDSTSLAFLNSVKTLLDKLSDPISGARNVLLDGLADLLSTQLSEILSNLASNDSTDIGEAYKSWLALKKTVRPLIQSIPNNDDKQELVEKVNDVDGAFSDLFGNGFLLERAENQATLSRRPLDHKKFLDMLVDDLEEKYIELLDGTRAQVANIDNYLKRVTTALDDDFNTQFYYPAFKYVREANVSYDVQFGQFETTTLLANNREFAKADPSATMEFDLPKRDILLKEGIDGAKAMMNDVGALASDPSFLAMAKLNSPNSGSSPNPGSTGGDGVVRSVLPGLGGSTDEQVMSQNSNGGQQFGSNLENLIPDPAIYKFETGTGFEIRPVIQPDGQAVVFDFNYMYSTEVREPVRADEKHLGRVKRHYVDTDVQLSNFELREVSRYTVALKAARTAKGVPLFEDIPGVGVLFRPLPSDENSLQQNLIMAQATIFPTLFDLMGLRWASVVSDLDPMALSTSDFIVRNRRRMLENRVYDESSAHVDEFLRVPEGERRMDLYRSQETVPYIHPNGFSGPGMNLQDSQLQEGYQPQRVYPAQPYVPQQSIEGSPIRSQRRPSDDWYFQNGTSASPDPNGIRGPGAITPLRGR